MAKGFKRRYFSLAAIAATVSVVQLAAQAAAIQEIQKVVVGASKEAMDVEDITDDVTVITADEIQERGFHDLKELLHFVTGASLVSPGGPGQPASLYLDGLNPNQTLILIDGIRYNDPTNLNGAALELIDLDNIQRIEIIKGAQSGLWGADAMGGVINIITKSAKKGVQGNFSVKEGSFKTWNGSVFYANATKRQSIAIDANRYTTQGFSAAGPTHADPLYGKRGKDLGWEDDGYQNRRIGVKYGYALTPNDTIKASVVKLAATVHYDMGAGKDAPDGPYTINDIDDTLYNIGYEKSVGIQKIAASYRYSIFRRSQYGGYEGSVKEGEIKDTISYMQNSFAIVGAGYQRFRQKKSGGILQDQGYQNHYIYLTNYNRYNGLILSQAIRHDNYNQFQDKTTYKIGGKYFFYKEYYIGANYATGYKAPSIFQLHYNATQNLAPEKSYGFRIFAGNDFLKVAYFATRVDNLITWIDPDNDWHTANDYYYNAPGTSRFKGYSIDLHHSLFDALYIALGYNWLSAKDAYEKELPRRAHTKLTYSLNWYSTDEHTITLDGYYVGSRYDTNGVQTGRYNVSNLTLIHRFSKYMQGFLEVKNIFDRFYQEIDGYDTPGRSYYIGVRASF